MPRHTGFVRRSLLGLVILIAALAAPAAGRLAEQPAGQAAISQPAAPAVPESSHPVVELLGHSGPYTAMARQGSLLYIGYGAGLEILDLSTPQQPRRLALMALYEPVDDLTVADGYVYITRGEVYASWGERQTSSIDIIDVRTPASPRLVARFSLPEFEYIHTLRAAAGRLYVGLSASAEPNYAGIRVYDLQDPASPAVLGFYAHKGVQALEVVERLVYVWSEGTLSVLDASNPAQFVLLDSEAVSGARLAFAVADGLIYTTAITCTSLPLKAAPLQAYECEEMPFQIYDVRNPRQIRQRGSLTLPVNDSYYRSITIAGPLAYLVRGGSLSVLDVSNPDSPRLLGQLNLSEQKTYRSAVYGSTVYVSSHAALLVLNLSNPLQPVEQGKILTVIGDRLSLSGAAALTFYDASSYSYRSFNPTAVLAEISPSGLPRAVAQLSYKRDSPTRKLHDAQIVANRVYLAGSEGLEIYDISQLASPSLVSSTTGNFSDLAVVSDTLYLVQDGTVRIYQNPESGAPQLLGTYGLKVVSILAVNNGLLYLRVASPDEPSFQIIDVRNPAQPALLGTLPFSAVTLALADGYAYLSGWSQYGYRLVAADVSNPASPGIVQWYRSCYLRDCYFVQDMVAAGGYLYLLDTVGLQILDARNPRALRVLVSINVNQTIDLDNGLSSLELVDGRIYVIGRARGLSVLQFSPEHLRTLFLPITQR